MFGQPPHANSALKTSSVPLPLQLYVYIYVAASVFLLPPAVSGRANDPCLETGNVTTPGKVEFVPTRASWFHEQRYGINEGALDRIAKKDETFGEMINEMLQKGWHDYSRAFCAESENWCKLSELRMPRRRLRAMVNIIRNGPYGEVYGNARLLDGTPITHMVSPGTEGPPASVPWPRLQSSTALTLQVLLTHLRGLLEASNCSRALSAESQNKSLYYQRSPPPPPRPRKAGGQEEEEEEEEEEQEGTYEMSDSEKPGAIRACQICSRYGVICRVVGEPGSLAAEVVALSILVRPNGTLPESAVVDMPPLTEVKALRVVSVPPGSILGLSKLLPGVKALVLTPSSEPTSEDELPDDISTEDPGWLGPWQHSVEGLSLSSNRSDATDALVCSMRGLRWIDFSGLWRTMPPCVGKLSELTEVCLVRVRMVGPDALPAELGALKNLRSIHAFSQDDGDCEQRPETWVGPPDWIGSKDCIPGYLYSVAEEERPSWRCPWRGWMERFDDLKAPWWGWEKMERFHVDANFWVGSIPEDIDVRWPHLRSLDLHDNVFTGPLPPALLRLENLTQLQVQANHFSCDPESKIDVVAGLFKHPRMRTLNLDQNAELCGIAPQSTRIEAQIGNTKITRNARDVAEHEQPDEGEEAEEREQREEREEREERERQSRKSEL